MIKKNTLFKVLTPALSILITYFLIFFFSYITLEKNFKGNFKVKETVVFYKKYFSEINHLRYKERYRLEKKTNDLIFNYIKKGNKKNILLFQGDSWFNQLNDYQSTKKILKNNLTSFSTIINGGTQSYSPSLMHKQYQILENEFDIFPNVVVIYIDQTDMGDELCRYKNLIKLDEKNNLISVEGEQFPYYQDVFNLHEKIILSEIELSKKNKFKKTQDFLNYKFKKFFIRIKKKISSKINKDDSLKKCEWQVIENYKSRISQQDKIYLTQVLKRYFKYLSSKSYIDKIYVITHPHKIQLTTNTQPIDISDIVSSSLVNFKKIKHINFKDILNNQTLYPKTNIWNIDFIHLNEESYNIFIKRIIEEIEN